MKYNRYLSIRLFHGNPDHGKPSLHSLVALLESATPVDGLFASQAWGQKLTCILSSDVDVSRSAIG
jgi:hypothetical protein